ncbi:unnamed protein product, partial [Scytosiphon promiscuus]
KRQPKPRAHHASGSFDALLPRSGGGSSSSGGCGSSSGRRGSRGGCSCARVCRRDCGVCRNLKTGSCPQEGEVCAATSIASGGADRSCGGQEERHDTGVASQQVSARGLLRSEWSRRRCVEPEMKHSVVVSQLGHSCRKVDAADGSRGSSSSNNSSSQRSEQLRKSRHP